jgi:hypothetical protein
MDPATIQLIVALLPAAEQIVFKIGEQLVTLNTSNLTDPATIKTALQQAAAEGFPVLEFKSAATA